MQRTFALIRRDTHELSGVVTTYLHRLEDFNYNRETHDLIVVEQDHPIFSAPHRHFQLKSGRIVRKPQEQIDAEEAARTE